MTAKENKTKAILFRMKHNNSRGAAAAARMPVQKMTQVCKLQLLLHFTCWK